MRRIKVMADYYCFPLWETSPGEVGNIDPQSLPISDELRTKLISWAKTFDDILNTNDPVTSDFSSDEAEANFIREGKELSLQLQKELGEGFIVEYKPMGDTSSDRG